MSDSVDPVRPILTERRAKDRRAAERRGARDEAASSTPNLPVPTAAAAPASAAGAADGASAFAAQLLGQDGKKRGLRGGPQALEEARSAYLEAEWLGPIDRRKPAGRVKRTEI